MYRRIDVYPNYNPQTATQESPPRFSLDPVHHYISNEQLESAKTGLTSMIYLPGPNMLVIVAEPTADYSFRSTAPVDVLASPDSIRLTFKDIGDFIFEYNGGFKTRPVHVESRQE